MGNRLFLDDYGKMKEDRCIYGDEERKEIFNKRGSLEAWVEGVRPIIKYPNVRFMMYAGFSAILLKRLSVDSFSVDLYSGIAGTENSDSSSGKTTTCTLVMSGIGNVDPSHGPSLFNKADSTTNFIINTMAKYPDLPTFFDDSSGLSKKDREMLSYGTASNVGRGRATSDGGTQRQQSKKGVALLNGEQQLIPDNAKTGTKVRVQEIKGGIGVPNIANDVDRAKTTCLENSGYILELYVDEFFKNRSSIKAWYDEARKRCIESTDNDLTKRKAAYFAVIETSGKLMEKVFNRIEIPTVDPQSIVEGVWNTNIISDEIEPLWLIALKDTWDWFNVNAATHFDIGQYARDTYGWRAVEKNTSKPLLNINKLSLRNS